jgi:C-terminal processing protease CtpA/Prc
MIAGLFAEPGYVVFSKQIRVPGSDRFTEPRLFRVSPREKNLAHQPLVVLTGPGTASGAEILVMATLPLPQARRLGAATMGILSDTFARELPNGWTVRLYSERYYTFDGGTFEATGLPPDIPVEYGLPDLERGRDTVLDAAVEPLRQDLRQ